MWDKPPLSPHWPSKRMQVEKRQPSLIVPSLHLEALCIYCLATSTYLSLSYLGASYVTWPSSPHKRWHLEGRVFWGDLGASAKKKRKKKKNRKKLSVHFYPCGADGAKICMYEQQSTNPHNQTVENMNA